MIATRNILKNECEIVNLFWLSFVIPPSLPDGVSQLLPQPPSPSIHSLDKFIHVLAHYTQLAAALHPTI